MKHFALAVALGALAAPVSAAVTVTDYTFTGQGDAAGLSGSFSLGYDDVALSYSLESLDFLLGGTTFDTTNAALSSGLIGGNVNGTNAVVCTPTCVDDFFFTFSLPDPTVGTGGIAFSVAGATTLSDEGQITFALAAPVTPGVPEPSTWAMMLLGFGVVGFAMRRRARLAATALG